MILQALRGIQEAAKEREAIQQQVTTELERIIREYKEKTGKN